MLKRAAGPILRDYRCLNSLRFCWGELFHTVGNPFHLFIFIMEIAGLSTLAWWLYWGKNRAITKASDYISGAQKFTITILALLWNCSRVHCSLLCSKLVHQNHLPSSWHQTCELFWLYNMVHRGKKATTNQNSVFKYFNDIIKVISILNGEYSNDIHQVEIFKLSNIKGSNNNQ